jgi:hypothetical protein
MKADISFLRIPATHELPEDVQTLHGKALEKLGFVPNASGPGRKRCALVSE